MRRKLALALLCLAPLLGGCHITSRHIARGAVVGAAVGATIGAVAGASHHRSHHRGHYYRDGYCR